MNTYMLQILQMLIFNNGEIETNAVVERLNITKRMINYYLKQLNEIFAANHLPEIVFSNEKMSLVLKDSQGFIAKLTEKITKQDYVLNADERQEFIVLLIGLDNHSVGIDTLIDFFDVSKNTIVNDLSIIKKELSIHGVELKSRNKYGYYFAGDESIIRYILMNCYHHSENFIMSKFKQDLVLDCLGEQINHETIFDNLKEVLLKSEQYTNEDFSYLALSDLVRSFLLIYVRAQKKKIKLNVNILENNQKMMEFIVRELAKLGIKVEDDEIVYLYLVLQSAKVSSYNQFEYPDEVLSLMDDIIKEFESISQLNLFGDNEISYMFLTHIKSMYYRTKFHIKITNFQDTNIDDTLGYYYIAQRVLKNVGVKYNLTYDDDEVRLLSYYFACLENNNDLEEEKENVVVVQISGLASSLFLRNQCDKLFDSQLNIKISDLRHLKDNLDRKTKLIISTVNLDESQSQGIQVIKVHSILTKNDKQGLLEWFLSNSVLNENQELVNDIIRIVQKNAIIKDKQKLYQNLNSYFQNSIEPKKLKLSSIFSSKYIKIVDHVEDWRELLYLAGEPIIKENIVKMSYIDDISDVINKHGPYCECLDGILVAHAVPKNNVECPVLSLAIVKEPLEVKEWRKTITAVFVLGVVDTELHASAFSELMANLVKDNFYERLHLCENCEEIYQKLVY